MTLGIIRGNEGGIAIESTEGVGTTFKVLMPLINEKVQVKEVVQKEVRLQSAEMITVLVIDDEEYVVEMVTDILGFRKYKHLSTVDPEEGIKLFREHWRSIDLVILDFSMPKLNGKEVFNELRKINSTVKVIISSGYTEEVIAELLRDDHPNAFIQKPYTDKSLLSLIQTVLEFGVAR